MTGIDGTAGVFLLAARVLFGLLLAWMSLGHFQDVDGMAGYAEAKGVPAPRVGVVASGVMLLLGGVGVAVGAYPVLSAGMLAVFFVVTTPMVHDFWAVPGDQRDSELTQFQKNVGLLGGSLAFLAIGGMQWAYSLGLTAF